MTDDLREVRVADLVSRGYGERTDVVGVLDGGGITGPPMRTYLTTPFVLARGSSSHV